MKNEHAGVGSESVVEENSLAGTTTTTDTTASASAPTSTGTTAAKPSSAAAPGETPAPAEASTPAEAPAPEPHYLLTIDEGVVEKVASLAAQKVDGIIDMTGGVLSMIQEGLGGSDRRKGVTADVLDEESVRVELSVILEYGKSALDAFDELKRTVTDDVKKMTGLNVADMTVNIVDVMDRDEFNRKRGTATIASDVDASDTDTNEVGDFGKAAVSAGSN